MVASVWAVCAIRDMADVTKSKHIRKISRTLLVSDSSNVFTKVRGHLQKQRVIGFDNGIIKGTQLTYSKIIVLPRCVH